ncbi:MAG: sodium:proton antiporter, partial [Sulfurospirillum sp.]
MITKDSINEKLQEVTYPGFTKSIVDFGFVKNIEVNGDSVKVDVDISSSAPEVKEELEKDIRVKLELLKAKDITINITTPKMPKESSSKGKNIAPH